MFRVFEHRVMRRIHAPTGDETLRDWRKFRNEELHLYSWQNIIRMIKSRRIRWAGHIAHTKNKCIWSIVGNTEGENH
jgi:hypothetical protein